jgi:hypothetical protein
MHMKKFFVLLLISISNYAFTQSIQNFSLTNVVDGKTVSLNDYGSYPGAVIIFSVNECAFDDYYIDRLKALIQQYQGKIPFLLVNADADDGESVENMIKRSTKIGITVPYLADKNQALMQALNAHKSTEAFLAKNSGGNFSIVYRGAIDDNPQVAADVRQYYLKDAIEKLIAGQSISTPEIRPVGCNIRRK